jgi:Fe-S cluster biogenesis protein NfuA/nitrite reductase/ring-hydroxylating ferredoxin subunit
MATQSLPGELLERVQELTAQLDELPDGQARELAGELLSAVIAMYGDGLARIMAVIEDSREAGATIIDELAQDGAVASLLLIHDLYPISLEERVIEALDTVRPYMESHGGNVELVALEDGVAKLALQGSCNGCAASRATLELAIKQALDEHCPDLAGLEVEGVTDPGPPPSLGIELPLVHAGGGTELPMATASEPVARWRSLDGFAGPGEGEVQAVQTDDVALLLANVGGSLLAYRDACASCGAPLHGGELAGNMLRCPECAAEFDLPRAGRAAGGEPLQLTPVPLLTDDGIRVAV